MGIKHAKKGKQKAALMKDVAEFKFFRAKLKRLELLAKKEKKFNKQLLDKLVNANKNLAKVKFKI
jgi:hypothetical protein